MASITIITCFTYSNNRKFVFNPDHLRSDLRRIISFSHNHVGSSLKEIYVLTDIIPNERICNEIIRDFQEEVLKLLRSQKIKLDPQLINRSQIYRKRPLEWLEYILKIVNSDHYRENILQEILPIISRESSVEFASLFTNFAVVSGKQEYEECLTEIFQRCTRHLFFYYSGHGVRLIDIRDNELSLVIPTESGQTEYFSQKTLQRCFQKYLHGIHLMAIFDCCYGERFLQQPYQIGFLPHDSLLLSSEKGSEDDSQVICLSGTRVDQTCGFYQNDRESSSLYTYFLFKFLNKISNEIRSGKDNRDIVRLCSEVEDRVQNYRKITGKPPQNMLIGLSNPSIYQLPRWIFKNSFRGTKTTLIEEE